MRRAGHNNDGTPDVTRGCVATWQRGGVAAWTTLTTNPRSETSAFVARLEATLSNALDASLELNP